MSNPNRQKGYSFEKEATDYFRDNGFKQAARTRSGSDKDRGDISGVGSWVIQCKNRKNVALPAWWRETEEQAKNHYTRNYCLLIKRWRKPISDAYAVVPFRLFVKLLRENRELKRELRRMKV